MDHLRGIVARAPCRHRCGRDQSREAQSAEVEHLLPCLVGELTKAIAHIATELLTVHLVDSVHRRRLQIFKLCYRAGRCLLLNRAHAIDGDGAREEKLHGTSCTCADATGHHEQTHRAVDVDLVGKCWVLLRAGREQRSQMIDLINILVLQLSHHGRVRHVTLHTAVHKLGQSMTKGRKVERNDASIRLL